MTWALTSPGMKTGASLTSFVRLAGERPSEASPPAMTGLGARAGVYAGVHGGLVEKVGLGLAEWASSGEAEGFRRELMLSLFDDDFSTFAARSMVAARIGNEAV